MTEKKKQPDIVDVLEEFKTAVLAFDKQLDKIRLPYVKLVNKLLADVVAETIEDVKYAKEIQAGGTRDR